MIRAGGILFVVGNTGLFLRRGNGGSAPNLWACPGGKMESFDSDIRACAIRETKEECGFDVGAEPLRAWTRTFTPATVGMPEDPLAVAAEPEDVDFTTFVVRLKEQFTPELDLSEHDGYAWAPLTAAPEPLHPGVRIALDRFSWDELGVARAMAAGTLTSPQQYENVTLFAIRITGTGASYRHTRKEFVWRDPSLYLNDDFLARCNGLSVIWEHPAKSLLNSDEHAQRIIGSVMLPYLRADKPDEVWAIAKIYDEDAIAAMADEQLSTSPAVSFSDPTKFIGEAQNEKITLEDGKVLLIEGKPSLLDHIAICPRGVWDKGGDPTGVESIDAVADSVPDISFSSINLLRAQAATLLLKASIAA